MILGITGGIATGKSTATAALSELGVRVIDCDALARWLPAHDTAVLAALALAFPDAVRENDVLDRAALGAIVFADATRRRELESILHPPIMGIVEANIAFARSRGKQLAVDVPLLYEGGFARLFDAVWVISVTAEVQIERLRARGGLTLDQTLMQIAAQMPLREKELQADRVLDNNGPLPELRLTVKREWESLARDHAN